MGALCPLQSVVQHIDPCAFAFVSFLELQALSDEMMLFTRNKLFLCEAFLAAYHSQEILSCSVTHWHQRYGLTMVCNMT